MDRRIDLFALLLLLGAVAALAFEQHAVGDVLVRRHPAAVRHRVIHRMQDAAVARGDGPLALLRRSDAGDDVAAILIDIAGEQAGRLAMRDELAQRAAAFHDRRREIVHFEVLRIADDDARAGVEHADALRHVAERIDEMTDVGAPADIERDPDADKDKCEANKVPIRHQAGEQIGHRIPAKPPKKMPQVKLPTFYDQVKRQDERQGNGKGTAGRAIKQPTVGGQSRSYLGPPVQRPAPPERACGAAPRGSRRRHTRRRHGPRPKKPKSCALMSAETPECGVTPRIV